MANSNSPLQMTEKADTQLSPRLDVALRQIEAVRRYTKGMLEGLEEGQWFWMPEPNVTHIAWQVGHLAMAQYGLTLLRQRGRAEGDSELLPGNFRKLFLKGSQPSANRADYPSPDEIIDVLDRVDKQMRSEFASFDGDGLDEPVDPPHIAFETRYGALMFASFHEMLHVGQIGLLRRLMGKPPLR